MYYLRSCSQESLNFFSSNSTRASMIGMFRLFRTGNILSNTGSLSPSDNFVASMNLFVPSDKGFLNSWKKNVAFASSTTSPADFIEYLTFTLTFVLSVRYLLGCSNSRQIKECLASGSTLSLLSCMPNSSTVWELL
jgi:hypothetical protein